MNKRYYTTLVLLMSFSLIGIILMQGYWIYSSWQNKEEEFTLAVNRTLRQVVNEIQSRELNDYVYTYQMLIDSIGSPDESNFTDVKGVNVLMHRIDNLNLSSLRSNLDELKNKIKRCLIIIIGENNQKSQVIVSVSKDIEQTFSAKAIMDLISSKTNLKGGGKNDFAQAGGDAIDNLESIYDLVTTYLENS